MFDSSVLETATGLIFLFLGVALVTMTVQEAIASLVSLRARTLRSGLKQLMGDVDAAGSFYKQLTGHPIIAPTEKPPSYISAQQFSTAVLDILGVTGTFAARATDAASRAQQTLAIAIGNMPRSRVQQALQSLLRVGEDDIAHFEGRVQQWFDQAMDRLSGEYKRLSQAVSFVIAGSIVFTLRIDAIGIGQALWSEPALRSKINDLATRYLQNAAGDVHGATQIPLSDLAPALANFGVTPLWTDWHLGTLTIFGCAITTLAAMLGAPFWFDILQRVANLRSTGRVPDRAPAPLTPN